MRFTAAVAAGAAFAVANAQEYLGFNSGATLADRSAKFKDDFVAEFETAANLNNSPGKFNAVRLYTNIQAYSEEEPIEAFEAAIETDTKILLGVWASGTDNIDKEIRALKKAVDTHGEDLTDLIIGVTIGSEDLYRISKTGIENESGVGNSPNAIAGFVGDWRDAFKTGPLSEIPVGHADTWDAWGNSTNKPVIDAVDFLAVHEYPYYENGKGNHIDNAGDLFDRAYEVALSAAGSKPVWVTETGWPYIGPDWDEAEANIKNAKKYWQEVGCRKLFGKVPTFWYTLRDSNPDNKMKFAITEDLSTEPLFDLSCPDEDEEETTSTTSSRPSSTSSSSPSSTETDEDEDEDNEEDEESSSTITSASPSSTSASDDDEEEQTTTSGFSTVPTVSPPTPTPTGGSGDDNEESNEDVNQGGDNSEEESNQGGDGPSAASGFKAFSVVSYVVMGLAGAAWTLI